MDVCTYVICICVIERKCHMATADEDVDEEQLRWSARKETPFKLLNQHSLCIG